MSFLPGVPLSTLFDSLDDPIKDHICAQVWAMIEQLRQIPKPEHLSTKFLCYTDGTECEDVLVKDLEQPPRPLENDDAVRRRITERYYHFYGRRYTTDEMYSMLPPSEQSVFTHADLAPRNILVDKSTYEITGIVDWECAGWYPDYWEMAIMWKGSRGSYDFPKWMDRSRPLKWTKESLGGIFASKRVLIG
jgi:hypothetical protein